MRLHDDARCEYGYALTLTADYGPRRATYTLSSTIINIFTLRVPRKHAADAGRIAVDLAGCVERLLLGNARTSRSLHALGDAYRTDFLADNGDRLFRLPENITSMRAARKLLDQARIAVERPIRAGDGGTTEMLIEYARSRRIDNERDQLIADNPDMTVDELIAELERRDLLSA